MNTMTYEFHTIGEMLQYYYGSSMQDVAKADDPVLTSTTGVYNPVFGAAAFSQLNNESNAFGLLPKYPWKKSGWRVISTDAGTTAGGGTAESGDLPAAIKPVFQEVSTKPKQVMHTFEVSMIHSGLIAKSQDDNLGDMAFMRGYFATLHAKRINEQLLTDTDTLAGYQFESIDRVTCTSAGSVACSNTAADEDIYSLDRSAVGTAGWANSGVMDHNSGTDRTLTLDLINADLAALAANGARTNIILTGYDTLYRIFSLAESQVRYQGVVKKDVLVQIGVNGVQTEEGQNYGVRVATLYGIPVFASQAVTKDTISRVYYLDTTEQEGTGIPRLGIALLHPTLYFESGMEAMDKNPFAINFTGTKGLYYTSGELICTFFKAQGQLRDLK
jgi:hypothetical protein